METETIGTKSDGNEPIKTEPTRTEIPESETTGLRQFNNPYDCVMSSLCLEAACQDHPTYTNAVKSLVSLAKPGAPIVLSGVLGGEYYESGGQRFPVLSLSTEDIRSSFESAGCKVKKFQVHRLSGPSTTSAYEGIFVMEATKQVI